jgi:2-phosphosulfolactate phosphatase
MKITLTFNPSELRRFKKGQCRVVVIDVLRACSTITHALAQGCKAIYPFASVRECQRKARELGREGIILGGERGGLRIRGFHLGNSPLEYTREVVEGRRILFTTTNCTKNLQALTRMGYTREVLMCSFLNLPAVAEYLAGGKAGSESASGGSPPPTPYPLPPSDWVHLALSGADGEVSLEDVVCGGMLMDRLLGKKGADLSDSARIAHAAYLHYSDNLSQALLDSTHGQSLLKLGMEKDIDFCAQVGVYNLLPWFSNGVIRLRI